MRHLFNQLTSDEVTHLQGMIFEFCAPNGDVWKRNGLECYNNETTEIQRLYRLKIGEKTKVHFSLFKVKRLL